MVDLRKLAGVWGPLAFVGAAASSARRVEGYSHVENHISGLAAQDMASAPIMIGGFVALGAAQLVQPVEDPLLQGLLRVSGAATLAAGLARCSSLECPVPMVDQDATTADALHSAASVTGFGIWTALPWLAARRPGPRWYRRASLALAVPTTAGFLTAAVTSRTGSRWRGSAQRAFLAPIFAWQAMTSLRAVLADRASRD